jgi:hypothetical protein
MPWCPPRRLATSLTAALVLLGAPLVAIAPAGAATLAAVPAVARPTVLPGVQHVVKAGTSPDGRTQHVAPSPRLRTGRTATAATAHISVTYHGFSAQAQAAFQAAVDVWQHSVTSSVPIHVDATWEPLPQGVLGQAGPTSIYCNVPGGIDASTCYPVAQANEMYGYDVNGSTAEISASFNSTFGAWYYGTDGATPISSWDLESVVLHEMGHGLGFISSVSGVDGYDASGNPIDTGLGYWGDQGYSLVFDRFLQNSGGTPVTAYQSGSFALGSLLRSNNLFWGGAHGEAALSGSRPRLYAPSAWEDGSSGSHLDEASYPAGTTNALMTPILNNGESIHDPGPVVLGMFQDMGWAPPAPPAPVTPGDRFVPLVPARVASVLVSAGHDVTVPLLGRGGLPVSGVDAVVANIAVGGPTRSGYLRVTPSGGSVQTGAQEFMAGRSVSNMVTVQLGAGGAIRLHLSAGQARIFIDLAGYYQPAAASGGATYHPIDATRIYGDGAAALSAFQGNRAVQVLGRGGIPATGVSAVVANVSVAGTTSAGYLQVTPAGTRTNTSVQQWSPGQSISSSVTVEPGQGGALWLHVSRGSARVFVDVVGWYGASGDLSGYAYHPVTADRSYGIGAPPVSSSFDRDIAVAGTSAVPLDGAVAVVANVEVAQARGSGYLRVTPGGRVSPTATQFFRGGIDVSNLAIVRLNQGMIKLHLSSGAAAVFVDVSGYFA